jgi:hypothetical protein
MQMSERIVCKTIGEVIEVLRRFPPTATVMSREPPFDSLVIVPQNGGGILFSSDHERWERERREELNRKMRKAAP